VRFHGRTTNHLLVPRKYHQPPGITPLLHTFETVSDLHPTHPLVPHTHILVIALSVSSHKINLVRVPVISTSWATNPWMKLRNKPPIGPKSSQRARASLTSSATVLLITGQFIGEISFILTICLLSWDSPLPCGLHVICPHHVDMKRSVT